MGVPVLALLEHMNLPAEGICRTAEIDGIRFLTDKQHDRRKLYLRREGGNCAVVYGDRCICLQGDCDEWFNRLHGCLDQFHQWELMLRYLLLARKLNEAMALLSEIFGNNVYLVDSGFRVLAIDTSEKYAERTAVRKHLLQYGYIPYHILSGLRSSGEMMALQSQKTASLFYSQWFNDLFINCCLYHEETLWGHMFVVGYRRDFTEGDLAYAQWVGRLLEEMLPQFANPIHSRNYDHEAFFLHVIERSLTEPAQIENQLRPLGWDVEGRFQAVAIHMGEEYRLLAPLLCDKLENQFQCRALIWKNVILAIFPADHSVGGVAGQVLGFIRQEALTAGISDVFDGFYRLPLNAEQAVCALSMGRKEPGSLTAYSDVAMTHLFQNLNPEFDLNMFCDKAVFRLREYDAANESDYLHTLEVFLKQERRLMDAARALFIHRNTLIYRIERIQKLTGLNLDDPDVRMRILLSCRIPDEYK